MNALGAIPPVLAPVPWKDLFRAGLDRSSTAKAADKAAAAATARLRDGDLFFFASGRAAMVAALLAFKRTSRRREVIVPAYTCYTVPSAVAAAGLVCVPCEISEEDFGFNLDALDRCFSDDTLCVVPTYLYGLPWDMEEVMRRSRERKVWVLEDAAQAFGGSWKSAPLGTFGDVGLFSFGRGKNVTVGHGGMLFVREPSLAEEIRGQTKSLGGRGFCGNPAPFFRTAAMRFLARPPFYGLVERIPSLEIGVSRFDPEINVEPLGRFELSLLQRVLPLAEAYRERRTGIALRYSGELAGLAHIRLPAAKEDARPAWLRFPILLPESKKDRLLVSPTRHCGLSRSYPAAVPDIPGIEPFLIERCACPRARRIAREIVTLPTHPGVREDHISLIVDCLRSLD